MRLIQFATASGGRAVAAIEDGEPRVVRAAASVRDLALEAHRSGRSLAETVRAHGLGDAVDYDARDRRKAHPAAARSSRPRANCRGADRADPCRRRGGARFHAREAAGRRPHRFHEDVQARPGGRQAGRRRHRRAAGMGLEGRRLLAGRAGAADRASGLCGGWRRGRGGRRPLRDRRRRRGAARRFRARQRIFRPRDGAAELSLSRPFQAAAILLRAGSAGRRPAGRGDRHDQDRAERRGRLARRAHLRRGEYVPFHRQSRAASFQVCAASAGRATCTSISTARAV